MDDEDAYYDDDDMCDGDGYYDYDNEDDEPMCDVEEKKVVESEDAEFECLSTFEVERVLNEAVAVLAGAGRTTPSLARMLLHVHLWDVDKVLKMLSVDEEGLLISSRIRAKRKPLLRSAQKDLACDVCAEVPSDPRDRRALDCNHSFCVSCWRHHFAAKLSEGTAFRIECMEPSCSLLCPSDFVTDILDKAKLKAKYERFLFRDYVMAHPHLKFCAGKDCQIVVRSKETKPKRVTCTKCSTSSCVICGVGYHAPTSCDTIRQWLIKCADDSETANYISAHTKDCPQCHACIEKNGGCNHMQCAKCRHHFCWMCFGDWKTHGSEYYECSRYKDNPTVAAEANHVKARRALEKYLHYFERFENHNKSLKMEEQLREKIRKKIDEKVARHEGTWIDWQYLHDAATLLTRCRYTLQYTYPFAYFLEPGSRKELFEYQQGQLEKEVEELAWAVERADSSSRSTLESHMFRAEHKRMTLLHDFFFQGSSSSSSTVVDQPSQSKK